MDRRDGAAGVPAMSGDAGVRVREAGPADLEEVLRLSHAVWGAGMSLPDYLAYNRILMESPWGRERLRLLVARDAAGTLLSSLKLYTLPGVLAGHDVLIAGIGAVFTPAARRGRGHAARLIERSLERARGRGCGLALLLSDIGAAYYERLGFVPLPATEAACRTTLPAPWPREPAWMRGDDPLREVRGLRDFREEDLDDLMAISAVTCGGQRFRIVRDRTAWEQAFLKMNAATRLRKDGADIRWVVARQGRIEAYALLKERPGALRWREHGARAGSEALLVDLFWAALALARRRGLRNLEGWFLPPAVIEGALYPVARRARRAPLVMIRPLRPGLRLPEMRREEECRIGEIDGF